MNQSTCSVPSCDRANDARGVCKAHYQRLITHGDLQAHIPLIRKPANRKHPFESADFRDGTRRCWTCGERKALDRYHVTRNMPLGRHKECKDCRNAALRARRANDPESAREYDKVKYRKSFNRISEARRERRQILNSLRKDPDVSKEALRGIDGDACAYCGVEMDFEGTDGEVGYKIQATLDHVIPVSKLGETSWGNCVLACKSCNSAKGATVGEWQIRDGHRLAQLAA